MFFEVLLRGKFDGRPKYLHNLDWQLHKVNKSFFSFYSAKKDEEIISYKIFSIIVEIRFYIFLVTGIVIT